MQVDPIKPMLKAPRSKRLKLRYDELLSGFAFKFNLRRYTLGVHTGDSITIAPAQTLTDKVERCRLTLSNPRLKAPGAKRLKLKL